MTKNSGLISTFPSSETSPIRPSTEQFWSVPLIQCSGQGRVTPGKVIRWSRRELSNLPASFSHSLHILHSSPLPGFLLPTPDFISLFHLDPILMLDGDSYACPLCGAIDCVCTCMRVRLWLASHPWMPFIWFVLLKNNKIVNDVNSFDPCWFNSSCRHQPSELSKHTTHATLTTHTARTSDSNDAALPPKLATCDAIRRRKRRGRG